MLEDGVGEDREEDGGGIREPGRLHYHPIERRDSTSSLLVQKLQELGDEILARGAAHAAVLEEDGLLIGAPEEVMVEANLAELVDEHGRIRQGREHPRKKGSLAASEEPRYDRYRSLRRSNPRSLAGHRPTLHAAPRAGQGRVGRADG